MSRPTPLSGFPELLPAERVVEREVIASLSRTFELHGFANIETRIVEPVEQLAKGGEIDIVGKDALPFHHDVEVMRVMVKALGSLPVPPLSFQVNNRKLIQGFYEGLGIPDVTAAIRQVDKLDKLPEDAVAELLVEN